MKPRAIFKDGKWTVNGKPFLQKKGGVFSTNIAFATILFICLFLIGTGSVMAEKYYDEWTDDLNIKIIETVEDQLGNPCSGCTVNITIFNPNSTVTNISTLLEESTPGKYNVTLGRMSIGRYPTTIFANKSGYNGTSDFNLLIVYDTFPEDTWWEIAGIFMFITLSSGSAIGYSKFKHNSGRIFLFLLTLLILIIQMAFIRSLLLASHIEATNAIVHLVDSAYQILIWLLRISFIWIFITFFVEIFKNYKFAKMEKINARYGVGS